MAKIKSSCIDALMEEERRRHQQELAQLRSEMGELLEDLRVQNMRFHTAINNISQGLCFFDGRQRLIVCNELYATMYKLTLDLVRPGTTLREIVDHRYAAGCFPEMTREDYLRWRDNIAASVTASDTVVKLRDGRIIAIHHQPMPDGGWVSTHKDITEARQAQEALEAIKAQLEQQALHDPLTGLANRRKFFERFELEVARSKRLHTPLALLMVDIDDFKAINDRFGHLAGDSCLRAVSVVLRGSIRKTDLAARFGGEEFVVLLPDTAERSAMATGERIRTCVEAEPLIVGKGKVPLRITVSIGAAAIEPGHAISFDELVSQADAAMYQAKANGKNRVCA